VSFVDPVVPRRRRVASRRFDATRATERQPNRMNRTMAGGGASVQRRDTEGHRVAQFTAAGQSAAPQLERGIARRVAGSG
jgi:hypothetical protein